MTGDVFPEGLGRCCVVSTRVRGSRDFGLDQVARRRIERHGQPPSDRLLACQLEALRSNLVDKACRVMMTPALRSCLSPRIGRSRTLSLLRPPSTSSADRKMTGLQRHAAG
jgi:hypothetical protein